MRVMTYAALVLLALPTNAQAQDHSAESVAAAILTGYVQRDAALIAPHSNLTNTSFFSRIVAGTEDTSRLFEGTRGEAGTNWDGMILPARYADNFAYVAFAIEGPNGPAALGSGAPGRYMAIVLELDGPEDTTWGFEDINYIDRATYVARAESRP